MKTYDNIDIALIFAACINTHEVLKATKIFKELANEGTDINLDLVRRFGNQRVRFFQTNE